MKTSLPAEVVREMEKSQARCAPAAAPRRSLNARHEVTNAGHTPSSIHEMNTTSNSEQYSSDAGGPRTGVVAEDATRQEAGGSRGAGHPSEVAGLASRAEASRGATQGSGAGAQHRSQAGHVVVRSCDNNSDSSATKYVDPNLMSRGKAKLAHVNYTFDQNELQKLAEQTRPFTRDDI